jgi:hypothetical protein
MIDTEPAHGGDIYKMLLGSVVEWYDSLDNPEPKLLGNSRFAHGEDLNNDIPNTPLTNDVATPALSATRESADIHSPANGGVPHTNGTTVIPKLLTAHTWDTLHSVVSPPSPDNQEWQARESRHSLYGVQIAPIRGTA